MYYQKSTDIDNAREIKTKILKRKKIKSKNRNRSLNNLSKTWKIDHADEIEDPEDCQKEGL